MGAVCKFKIYDTCTVHNSEKKVIGGNVEASVNNGCNILSVNGNSSSTLTVSVSEQTNAFDVKVECGFGDAPDGTEATCTLKYTNKQGDYATNSQKFIVKKQSLEEYYVHIVLDDGIYLMHFDVDDPSGQTSVSTEEYPPGGDWPVAPGSTVKWDTELGGAADGGGTGLEALKGSTAMPRNDITIHPKVVASAPVAYWQNNHLTTYDVGDVIVPKDNSLNASIDVIDATFVVVSAGRTYNSNDCTTWLTKWKNDFKTYIDPDKTTFTVKSSTNTQTIVDVHIEFLPKQLNNNEQNHTFNILIPITGSNLSIDLKCKEINYVPGLWCLAYVDIQDNASSAVDAYNTTGTLTIKIINKTGLSIPISDQERTGTPGQATTFNDGSASYNALQLWCDAWSFKLGDKTYHTHMLKVDSPDNNIVWGNGSMGWCKVNWSSSNPNFAACKWGQQLGGNINSTNWSIAASGNYDVQANVLIPVLYSQSDGSTRITGTEYLQGQES